jgi:uncharacterized OB-fold protein
MMEDPGNPIRKPLPRPSPESVPFWEGAKAGRLMLPRCNRCGRFWFPPSQRCRHCLSADFEWRESAGKGRIYSFVVYHRTYHPAFETEVPYVVAIVELDEGPRLLTNIVGTPPDAVRCDQRVRAVFEDVDGVAIPKFAIDA